MSGIAWPVIESVEGRVRDGVTLPDGSFHMVFLYGSVLVHDPRVRGFAVLKFDNTIVACLTSEGEIDSDLAAQVQSEVGHMFKLSLPVVVRKVAALPPVGAKPRREWFPAVGDYVETMTDEQVLASAY